MNTIKVKITEIKSNPNNPRLIKDDKFKKLVQSIKDFPEMLDIRPIVVNADMVILGGNIRYKTCKKTGLKSIPIIVSNLSEDKQKEFLIKDNTSGGEWDWDILANEWDVEQLEEWGLDVPNFEQEYEEIIPSGYEENQKWFLNIEFENEKHCQEWYDKLINEGLICKIVQ